MSATTMVANVVVILSACFSWSADDGETGDGRGGADDHGLMAMATTKLKMTITRATELSFAKAFHWFCHDCCCAGRPRLLAQMLARA